MRKKFFLGKPFSKIMRQVYTSFNVDKYLALSPELINAMPEGAESYNEVKYLELNPDVSLAVKRGQFEIGWDHYIQYGRQEGRPISDSDSAPLPPVRLMVYIGSRGPRDFIYTGKEFVNYLSELCALKPEHSVLEVGCGCGRMAIPLANRLSEIGRYHGFDIDKDCITWAQNNISLHYPNFTFVHADIFNHYYHPKGTYSSEKYTFPYENDSFDNVFLTSVFTHLLPNEMEHYLSEITRVLKIGGKCLITFFIINGESQSLIANNKSGLGIRHKNENFWTSNPSAPGEAVGYEESHILKLYNKFGFNNITTHYGSWCGRKSFLSYQDLIIAEKIG